MARSNPFPILSSLASHIRLACIRSSHARVFSDNPCTPLAFEAELATSLQKLHLPSCGDMVSASDLISLEWMSKALDVVISLQTSAKHALDTHEGRMASFTGKETSKMMQQFLEDSIKMLDVCFVLKEALSRVTEYASASQVSLKRLQGLNLVHQGDTQRAKHALLAAKRVQERVMQALSVQGASLKRNVQKQRPSHTKRLAACSSTLRKIGDKLIPPRSSTDFLQSPVDSMLSSTLYGAQVSTIFFLRLVSIALSDRSTTCHHKASSSMMSLLPHRSRQAPAWMPSLLVLQSHLSPALGQRRAQRRSADQDGCMTRFPELHMFEASMNRISDAVWQLASADLSQQSDVKQMVDSASTFIQHTQSSIARLEKQIDKVYSSIVDMRVAMLGAN